MKILYSFPHPADRLGSQGAGHVIRATALLNALEMLGNEVVRVEAASESRTRASVGVYRNLVRNLLPRHIAMKVRDLGRIRHGKRYAVRLLEAAQRNKPDLILETHIAFSLAGKIVSERTGVPLVLDDCSPAWEEEQQYGVGLRDAALRIHREVTGHASLVIAVNDTMRKYLLDGGLSADRVITVENGFDESIFNSGNNGHRCRKRYQIPGDAVVIVFVGSFQPYHRVDLLLEAFSAMPNEQTGAYLLLVGGGRSVTDCRALAEKLGVTDRVIFTDRIAYEDVPSHVAAGDIAVMPATNSYGNPMKIYEYMAMGKAVVAPFQPTIEEIATHGKDSFLFEPENIGSLAQALDALVVDQELRRRLGEQGRRLASEHTWNKRAVLLQSAFERALQ